MGWGGVGWFFSDYRFSPNFFVVLGLRLWLRLGLGCDNIFCLKLPAIQGVLLKKGYIANY